MRHFIVTRQATPAWTILAASLLATVVAWQVATSSLQSNHRKQFDVRVNAIVHATESRLEIYRMALHAAAAFFESSEGVSRSEWKNYVEHLDISRNYPGIQGIGYSVVVRPEDRERHIESVRAEGFPAYDIWPAGERPIYTSILYLEPFDWRNQRAFGYDMFSEPVRRAAMETARDTGEPSASSKVLLVQETEQNQQAGFLIYVPVYEGGRRPWSLTSRRDSLEGWIYSPFRMDDLMRGIYGPELPNIRISVYDGTQVSPEALLHDSCAAGFSECPSLHPLFEAQRMIDVGAHVWTVRFASLPSFENQLDRNVPFLVLSGGLVTSILLFALAAYIQARRLVLVEAHRAAQRSLTEKDMLLREIHHRVKNSLQIVTSMLTMQSRQASEAAVRRELDEAVSRVRAVAQIHQRLYSSDDVQSVDFGAYLRSLGDDLTSSGPDYTIRIDAKSIDLPTDQAIPLGLILVELVTNALKHAQAPDNRKAIDIHFGQTTSGELELRVRDHGIGMPEGFSLEQAGSSLGMRMILAFALQLEADIRFEDAAPGTRWTVRFRPGMPEPAESIV